MDIEALLHAALLAPSSHNTQPWVFQTRSRSVRLLADRSRALPVNDPHDRELTISCGCALFNLRVAASRHDIGASVSLFPEPEDPDVLAEISLGPKAGGSEGLGPLADELGRRRTYRKRFDPREVTAEIARELSEAAEAEGATLHLIEDKNRRDAVADLVAEGDSVQWSDASWRRELAWWMHSRRQGDGLTVPGLLAPMAQAVVRTFDLGNRVAAKDRQLAEASPVIMVMATAGDAPEDWLTAGQSLERTLLKASRHGLQASYLNQPIQVASLRPKLQDLIPGNPFPQIVLRLGYPTAEIGAAPRRELEEVIDRS